MEEEQERKRNAKRKIDAVDEAHQTQETPAQPASFTTSSSTATFTLAEPSTQPLDCALIAAVENVNEAEVQRLLDAKANHNALMKLDHVTSAPILVKAVQKNSAVIAKALLDAKADPFSPFFIPNQYQYSSALKETIVRDHDNLASMLLDYNPKITTTYDHTLDIAIRKEKYAIANRLLDAKANAATTGILDTPSTPLSSALSQQAPVRFLLKLLEHKATADFNTELTSLSSLGNAYFESFNRNALETAIEAGNPVGVYVLLEAKAIPRAETFSMRFKPSAFPISKQTEEGRKLAKEVVELYAKNSPQDKQTLNSKLLFKSVQLRDIPTTEWLLLDKKADPNIVAALPLATQNNDLAMVKKLIELNADVNITHKKWTPLLMAISAKSPLPIIQALLDAKADTTILHPVRNIDALAYAKEKKYEDAEQAIITARQRAVDSTTLLSTTSPPSPAALLSKHSIISSPTASQLPPATTSSPDQSEPAATQTPQPSA